MGWLVDETAAEARFWQEIRARLIRETLTALITTDEAAAITGFLDRFEKLRVEKRDDAFLEFSRIGGAL
jgi:hypothetical protein